MPLADSLLGRRLATHEEEEQRVGVLAGIPMLGLDALSSSAYGPEAALTLLLPLGTLGIAYIGPISLLIIALLFIVYLSYRQTIAAYPNGGGSYTVAKENLGVAPGLLAAAALMIDYVLTVAVGISAGVGALVSAFPFFQPYTLLLCLAILGLIVLVNLRGVRESGIAFMVPTYVFVISLLVIIAIGLVKTVLSGGHPIPVIAPPSLPAATATASIWLLMRAFASGCTAMTGVEAVSNGVSAFRKPAVLYARRTLTAIIVILAVLLAGIAYLARIYNIGATEPGQAGYQSVLSLLVAAVIGRGTFYYITIIGVIAVLALSANTGFADFPRLCRIVAQDDFLPHAFANRGRRLVFSQGIFVLAALSGLLLIIFGGITDRLIPLFAVGAFLAFTMSQAGMVAHWRKVGGPEARRNRIINGVGALATGITLLVVLVSKFVEGAWITVLLIPLLLILFMSVRRHYDHVAQEIATDEPLDVASLQPPIVILPIKGWNSITRKALRFALKVSPDVRALFIAGDEQQATVLRAAWTTCVVLPTEQVGLSCPQLIIIPSPYRQLYGPLLDYVKHIEHDYPDRQIAVIVPELVEKHWHHYLLHNQTASVLKALLLFSGGRRIVVINVPWYLTA